MEERGESGENILWGKRGAERSVNIEWDGAAGCPSLLSQV